ncbi:hypothetical protein RIF29_00009 [Crotalaria pallida]|uniref:Uncharacterized protein n=1 Tax=Crotalaria pallida TaxID=3830 RepID=A0AAN9IW49_CROPI
MVYCIPAFEAWAYIHTATAKVCILLGSAAIAVLEHSLEILDKNKSRTVPGMRNTDMVGEHNTSQVADPLEFVANASTAGSCLLLRPRPPRSREMVGTTPSTFGRSES